ncbi:MAG: hypothetical protein IJJ91_02035 [Synergistaceae bacterium]|nr:hypothetical protein [Synergistaceae bacterium]MBQ3759505.1 hypothetical protein [Synergistaceae bacterium]MBQ6113963.1 hypothetical protein [Synergistaceae bacterium]MBQ6417428.1 hypothetical protein [Synergistaceae bacterium]
MKSVCVVAPSDAFDEFSYATEHVTYDAVIEVLLSCYKAFRIIDDILDEDYSDVLQWIDACLNEVWDERGAFPGLGSMLCATKVKYRILVVKEITEKAGDNDIWEVVDQVFNNPGSILSASLAVGIDDFTCKMWDKMTDERKQLFKLLSRFDLTIKQAEVLFQQNQRSKEDIPLTDAEIIANPYLLYEGIRLKREDLVISVKRIDRAVFPVESIRTQYPLEAPTVLTADNDVRRVRALAENGSTILPAYHLVDRIQEMPLQPECGVTLDHLAVIEDEISSVIVTKQMKHVDKYYKLKRYEDFAHEIERKVRKKLKSGRIDIETDWGKLLDDYLTG